MILLSVSAFSQEDLEEVKIEKKQKGIGMDNIKSRAAHYNGTAGFTSQPGQGCMLEVVFPTPVAFA